MTKLKLAIVGAGPAGIYAADLLLEAERKFDVSIDLFEQLHLGVEAGGGAEVPLGERAEGLLDEAQPSLAGVA